MARRSLLVALCATLQLLPTANSRFLEPSSDNSDFVQEWFVGDTINIEWDAGWNFGVGEQPETVDLFVMWFDDRVENPFWKLLEST